MGNQKHHKALQLSRQAERALSLILGEPEETANLLLMSVKPAPGGGGLVVSVALPEQDMEIMTESQVMELLERHRGRMRTELARCITRKKAPFLSFQYGIMQEA